MKIINIIICVFLFAFNLSAQFQLGSVPNNELDSIKYVIFDEGN